MPFKRVEYWRYGDLEVPPTVVEVQLRRHFEGVFAHAEFSPELTCFARETARFFEVHSAMPEESLGSEMMARCGAPAVGSWHNVDISSATVLDSPLSPELLANVARDFINLPNFNAFGVTARYVGTKALVHLQVVTLDGSMHVGTPDGEGNVRVEGSFVDNFRYLRALINHGGFGTKPCEVDATVSLPRYALMCQMAVGDDEAWIELQASHEAGGWQHMIGQRRARRSGSVPPAEYQRVQLELPPNRDPAAALVAFVNQSRAKLGVRPLAFSREQSSAIQPVYDEMFKMNAGGNWTGDADLRAEVLKGKAVHRDIEQGRIVTGIAFDGDAADWLSYRLTFPDWREALMDSDADEIAVATRGDPAVGFGALAALYSFFTPARERALADDIAGGIAQLRAKLPTRRLENPLVFDEAARQVVAGRQPPDAAFTAALERLNLEAKGRRFFDGVLVEIPWSWRDFELPDVLLVPDKLEYGVVATHHKQATNQFLNWARPIVFVWFIATTPDQPARQRQRRSNQ